MIILDASVLIAHLDDRDVQHERARSALDAHAMDPFGASVVTLAQTLVSPARSHRTTQATGALSLVGVVAIPVDETAPTRLAELRAETDLRLPDCCVLLAAQDSGASTVLTFDERLSSEAQRLGFATP